MLETFLQHTAHFRHRPVFLAVSGGLDSVVLAHLTAKAGMKATLLHCNFQLRGEESLRDEAFVISLAETLGFEVFIERFETSTVAQETKTSTQMAARKLRYAWFAEHLATSPDAILFTAHHRDDSLETALLNFTKGTGLAGLTGIPAQNGQVYRPLLWASRKDILAFAEKEQLAWVEDSSNASVHYQRNKIRHEVLPKLTEINPNISETFIHTAERLTSTRNLIDSLLQPYITAFDNTKILRDETLNAFSEPLFLWTTLLLPYGFAYPQARDIYFSKVQTGRGFASATHKLLRNRNEWRMLPIENPVETVFVTIHDPSQIWESSYGKIIFNAENQIDSILFDADKLRFPVVIRSWQAGDYFYPSGMHGKRQKVSDLLINKKIPLHQKKEILVMEADGKIAWVLGLRTDERFLPDEKTQRTIGVKFEG